MSAVALWTGGIGLALLLAIRLAGTAARSNRQLLVSLFEPGLYFTAIVLIGLTVVHAAIAMGVIYYVASAGNGRVPVQLIALIGIGAVIGIVVLIRNLFSLVCKAQTIVIGKQITHNDAPALWEQVDKTAKELGSLTPERIVVGLEPNFFVTEADVVCLDVTLSGRTLYCSLPLCRILNQEEFTAIIGHELGHYKGLDTQFSQKFFPIYRGTISSIASLQETGSERPSMMIARLPAIAVLSYFLESFSVAESNISRIRELEADQQGAKVTNELTLASALVKLHAFAGAWEDVRNAAISAVHEGKVFVNASKTYSEIVSALATPDAFKNIAETGLAHPTDSHPPLAVRLEALNLRIEDVSESALAVQPIAASINFIAKADGIEQEISGAYQALLVREYGIDLDSVSTSSTSGC